MEKRITKRQLYGIVKDGVLTRTCLFRKHFFWQYEGYAFGDDYLKALESKYEIHTLRINELDTQKSFVISYADFKAKSRLILTPYGRQRVININELTQDYGDKADSNTLQSGHSLERINTTRKRKKTNERLELHTRLNTTDAC